MELFFHHQSTYIQHFRSNPTANWDVELGILFLKYRPDLNLYYIGTYRHTCISVFVVKLEQLSTIGFYHYPLIFCSNFSDLAHITLRPYQTVHTFPLRLDRSLATEHLDYAPTLVHAFALQLFRSRPDLTIFGETYINCELIRARHSLPVVIQALVDANLPLQLHLPSTPPYVYSFDNSLIDYSPEDLSIPPINPTHPVVTIEHRATTFEPVDTTDRTPLL